MKNIVIVESPIKAGTFQEYLDSEARGKYNVIASGGHIKDLPVKKMGISIERGVFHGNYELLSNKSKFLSEVKKSVKEGAQIFVCTDDDREGERICEDIIDTCGVTQYYRYAPRELNKNTIINAIINKTGIREINENVVRGQMVRREADRILGYGLSPAISWAAKNEDFKTHGTGRVEAIALDIIYDRHTKIQEYQTSTPQATDIVKALYKVNGIPFELMGEKLEYEKGENEGLENAKYEARNNPHVVNLVESNIIDRVPPPPLITSSLYATASYLFKLEPSKTKKLAQELFYCGVINYPRTDSYMLSDEVFNSIVDYLHSSLDIEDHDDIKKDKRTYKNKKGAQAAHEAIRPMIIDEEHAPQNIMSLWSKGHKTNNLTMEHLKVYELIWIYAITTQLESSRYQQTEIVIRSGSLIFKGKSHEPISKGWEKYYGLKINESSKGMTDSWREKEIVFPSDIHVGMVFSDSDRDAQPSPTIDSYERPSRAPKRISAGMLIGMLETLQVARPSTMHTISAKLIKKGYVTSDSTLFSMTNSGVFVAQFNESNAPELIDRKEATKFEDTIVKIEEGEIKETNDILKEYWDYVQDVKDRVGYIEYEKREPTEAQLKLAKSYFNKLSKEEQDKIPSNTFDTFVKTSEFINNHSAKAKKEALEHVIGDCPKCKKNTVAEKDKVFTCLNEKCKFVLYKNSITKLLSSMGKDMLDYEITNMVTVLLRDKVVFFTGLNTKFGAKDVYFEIKYSKKYSSYSLSFVPNKQEIEEGKGLWEQIGDVSSRKINSLENENRLLLDAIRKDELTRAFNRKALEGDLETLIKNKDSNRINNKISMVFFDGDKFKQINDTYGHETGDSALKMIVNTCFSAIKYYKANANVYRYGGDEFVMLFYNHEKNEVLDMVTTLCRSIAQKDIIDNKEDIKMTVSMGVAHYKEGDSSKTMREHSDEALYRIKKSGGNGVMVAA